MDVASGVALALSAVSIALSVYTWYEAGPRLRITTRFTTWFAGVERGGNHFALEVTVSNSGRGAAQIVGWGLVSKTNKTPDGQRWGVTHTWNGGPVPGSDPLPMRLEGKADGRWTISLVDNTNAFPALDQLIPDREARVEVQAGGHKNKVTSDWFELPPRSRRRSSHEIAADNPQHRAQLDQPRQPGAFSIVDLLVDPPPFVSDQPVGYRYSSRGFVLVD